MGGGLSQRDNGKMEILIKSRIKIAKLKTVLKKNKNKKSQTSEENFLESQRAEGVESEPMSRSVCHFLTEDNQAAVKHRFMNNTAEKRGINSTVST